MKYNEIDSVECAVNSVKDIIIIISGLIFTMAIIQFFTIKGSNPKEYSQFIQEPISFFIFILIMINVVRFCYGNLRHLDESFLKKQDITSFDYIFPLMECLTFCIMSIYLSHFTYFFGLFGILLLIDCIWLAKNWTWERLTTEKEFIYQRNWIINNMCAFFLLVIFLIIYYLVSNSFYSYVALTAIFLIGYFNTIIDFKQNWKDLYFPKRVRGAT